jgi:M6 family metalloprotease-like protein
MGKSSGLNRAAWCMGASLAVAALFGAAGCGEGTTESADDPGAVQSVESAVTVTPTISSPADGTVFKTTAVTFTWSSGADEYWLNIGRASGGSDVFQSPSLGTATTFAVPGLPLDGGTLYVQLKSRFGSTITTSSRTYTAAMRKGLVVVADFSDSKLEDYTGNGVKSLLDVSTFLGQMKPHWEWLSRNTEKVQWTTIRVTIPRLRTATAFAGWGEYRDTVLALARQVVNVADYDVNGDGDLDGVWIIASDKGSNFGYLVGGTSGSAGGRVFVDPQGDASFIAKAYGNFNHEFGHCVGNLPDLYGDYSTIGPLSLMSDSWALPPNDYTAYERVQYGWVKPTTVTQTTLGITLASANTNLAAIRVQTQQAESFLIEYRVTPTSGFGSTGPKFNGLIVYHYLDGSSQSQNPPLLKVEPADGVIGRNVAPDLTDALYPGNPGMPIPFYAKSYVGNQNVFHIQNLAYSGAGAMTFDLIIDAPSSAQNLISDSSVELGSGGIPTGWSTTAWQPALSTYAWDATTAHSGTHSVSVTSSSGNDAEWRRTVPGLNVGQSYQLCGWIKGQNIVPDVKSSDTGGSVAFTETWTHTVGGLGTFGWKQACVTTQANATSMLIGCRLGYWGNTVAGKLWCDDFSLVPLTPNF